MPRVARAVAPGVPHHVTQRGNRRCAVFTVEYDYLMYLDLLRRYSREYGVEILSYCLMPNHVHLVATPSDGTGLGLMLRNTHGRYASLWNGRNRAAGHLWQGRFYSCAMDNRHLWAAVRYVEWNPVRAGIVTLPEHYRWSSAAAYLNQTDIPLLLAGTHWQAAWTRDQWREFSRHDSPDTASALRKSTQSGRPLGSLEFVADLERQLGRSLGTPQRGRPRKRLADETQLSLGDAE